MYSKKVMEHFMHPKNMGEIKKADGIGKVGNPVCGDVMYLYVKIGKNKKKEEIISDIKFKTLGCASAIATSSMMTELAKGKTIEKALNITKKDVADALQGLPPIKMHCSNLAEEALKAAIGDYMNKNKKIVKKETKKSGKYTENSTLEEVMEHPKADKLLTQFSVPCYGCPMAQFEMQSLKLKDIAVNYGIELKKLLKELNK